MSQSPTTTAKLKEFTVAAARPLPVIVLADVSGSMEGAKIDSLNLALGDMLKSFVNIDAAQAEPHVAIITFGGAARLHTPLAPAKSVTWSPASANGNTPLGAALELALNLVEDRSVIPSRAYRPYILLASDGQPNDAWHEPLQRLLRSERGSKASRVALAIGDDADEAVLRQFLANPEERIFRASEASTIKDFFRAFTMSVVVASRTPGAPVPSVSQAIQQASGHRLVFDD
jgi:uncharacterized protein YegL